VKFALSGLQKQLNKRLSVFFNCLNLFTTLLFLLSDNILYATMASHIQHRNQVLQKWVSSLCIKCNSQQKSQKFKTHECNAKTCCQTSDILYL